MPHPPDAHEKPHWIKARVADIVWRITPHCREVARLTSEQRDHPLPLGVRMRLGLHRAFCKWCTRYARQLDLLQEAAHRFPEHLDEIAGPALPADAKARLKRATRE
jgi:hypothetical protein